MLCAGQRGGAGESRPRVAAVAACCQVWRAAASKAAPCWGDRPHRRHVRATAAPLRRADSKGLMQQCLPAQLLISGSELERGLDRHPMCPDWAKRWHKGEQLVQAGALVL